LHGLIGEAEEFTVDVSAAELAEEDGYRVVTGSRMTCRFKEDGSTLVKVGIAKAPLVGKYPVNMGSSYGELPPWG